MRKDEYSTTRFKYIEISKTIRNKIGEGVRKYNKIRITKTIKGSKSSAKI